MDRDRHESHEAFENRTDRHGPFGVRDDRPSALPSVEDVSEAVNRLDDLPSQTSEGSAESDSSNACDGQDPALEHLRERIIDAMKTVYDPEIPVNIYDLGMVYEIEVRPDRSALVTMTLTSPACPVAGTLPGEVEEKLIEVEGVRGGKVELVWDPPWTPDRMSEAAKLELGMF